jgi:hypothetical protein
MDATTTFAVADGADRDVPIHRAEFEAATRTMDLGPWTYNIKPQLLWRDRPLVPELLLAEIFIEAGWEAAWVDSFASERIRTEMPPGKGTLELPDLHREAIGRARNRLGRKGGHWDVVAFREDRIAFVESKGPGDTIRKNQTGSPPAWPLASQRARSGSSNGSSPIPMWRRASEPSARRV